MIHITMTHNDDVITKINERREKGRELRAASSESTMFVNSAMFVTGASREIA